MSIQKIRAISGTILIPHSAIRNPQSAINKIGGQDVSRLSFESIAAYGWTFNFLVQDEGSESLEGMWVTKDYFRVTGLEPQHGRAFLDSDTVANAPPVIILGNDLWRRRFNGDPNIIGKTICISRRQTRRVARRELIHWRLSVMSKAR